MRLFISGIVSSLLALFLVSCNASTPSKTLTEEKKPEPVVAVCSSSVAAPGENILYLQLKTGCVAIELLPALAPKHVERIKTLVRKKFYDGIVFHRVIGGFMAQTGDPTGTGRGGSDLPDLEAEFSKEPFKRGILGMARSADPHSANSQFFIMFAPGDFLNGKYTVFGKVISGMEHVDQIKKGDPSNNGAVDVPDKIIKMQMSTG